MNPGHEGRHPTTGWFAPHGTDAYSTTQRAIGFLAAWGVQQRHINRMAARIEAAERLAELETEVVALRRVLLSGAPIDQPDTAPIPAQNRRKAS